MNPFEPPDDDQGRQERRYPGAARVAVVAFLAAVARGVAVYLMHVIVLAGIGLAAWGALLALFESPERRSESFASMVVGVALVKFFWPKIEKY